MNATEQMFVTLPNYHELLRGERLINDQIGTLDKAEQCGIECSGLRSALQQVADRYAALKKHFFTPPPTR